MVATTLQLNSLLEDEAARYLAAQTPGNGNSKQAGSSSSSSKILKGNK